jgi:hypothetical protein
VFENGQAHIILHFNREVRRVQWFIRDVDEYKNGVDWMTPFDTRWCTSRGGYYVGLQQAADLLMASLPGTSRDRTTAAPTLLVNHFTALLEAATKLRQPRFVTTPTGRTWAIALHDGEAAAPVRVEHAVLTRGIVTPADTSS